MTSLERDLIRWEKGELTLDDVEAAHPEVGIRELVRVHTRLSMLRAIPMPDVERAWTMTISKLDDRGEPMMARMRAWARKPLIASFASVAMTGGAAYAAGVDPVERAVDRAWAGLSRVVNGESRDARDVAAERATATTGIPTSETDPVVSSTAPPGDDADGERGKSKTKGKSADHRKDEENRHRGWVNRKDKDKGTENKGKRAKPETPVNGSAPPGHTEPAAPAGGTGKEKDKDSTQSEAADDSGDEAPTVEEPPAPPPPAAPANSNAGGNGKGKDKTRLL